MTNKPSLIRLIPILFGLVPGISLALEESAKARIDATLNAKSAQFILTGTFVEEGPDWRGIKVDRWLLYPFSEQPPDTMRIMRTPGRLDSLVSGTKYLLYLNILMDAVYGATLAHGSPLLPLSQSQADLKIAEQVAKKDWHKGEKTWGTVEDSVRTSDSVVFLNFTSEPMVITEGKAIVNCPLQGQAVFEFTSITRDGIKKEHWIYTDATYFPPLEIPVYDGILLTDFRAMESNGSCGPAFPESDRTGATLVFRNQGHEDSLAYRGFVGGLITDRIWRSSFNSSTILGIPPGGPEVDVMGRRRMNNRPGNSHQFFFPVKGP